MSAEDRLVAIVHEVGGCTKCPLHESRTRAVPGEGPSDARVLIVGEGPGSSEDREGRPFVGAAGQNLQGLLSVAGLKRESVFITNVVKCRPPGNRRPAKSEADMCYPYLRRQVELINPEVVVLLGDTALKQFFPDSSLGDVHGRPVTRSGRTFFPTYHPASMIYNRALKVVLDDDFANLGSLLRTLPG
jgi:DNA polymerase